MATKYLIWKSDFDVDEYADFLDEEYPYASEEEKYDIVSEMNASYLSDERENLDIQLKQPILVIGELGLWYGKRIGYKEIESGNIKDCLYDSSDSVEWFLDGRKEFRCVAAHHDGINRYMYRVYKEGVSEEQKDALKRKLYQGKACRADITRYTESVGKYIAEVYGW